MAVTLNWTKVAAVGNDAAGMPDKPGLYVIMNGTELVYIGKAHDESIRKRWSIRVKVFDEFDVDSTAVFTKHKVAVWCAPMTETHLIDDVVTALITKLMSMGQCKNNRDPKNILSITRELIIQNNGLA